MKEKIINLKKFLYEKNEIKILSILMFIVGVSILLMEKPISVCDYWWHVKAGEYIVQTGQIPKTGIFSWYGSEFPWISHEWLSEVVLYFIDFRYGVKGGFFFCLLAVVLFFTFIFACNKELFLKNIWFSLGWIIAGAISMIYFITPRPHMISFLLLIFTMYSLESLRRNPYSKKIWFLPVISCLWANFHGGSSNLPYVLGIIYLIGGSFNFSFWRVKFVKYTKSQFVKYLIAILLAMLFIFINPHGLNMFLYPYVNAADHFMFATISEWRAPDFKIISDLACFVPLFVSALILLISKDDIDGIDILLIGAFIYLSFRSVRFLILFYIVASFIIFKYIKPTSMFEKYKGIMCLCWGMILFIGSIVTTPFLNQDFEYIEKPISQKVIEEIKKDSPKRLYNHYDLGSYLIYNDIPVFIDGRADMYSKYNYKDNHYLMFLKLNPKEIMEKYNFDAYIVPKKTSIYYYLKELENLDLIIEDEDVAFFKSNSR